MGYPIGPLLQAIAQRLLANMDFIERHAPDAKGPDRDRPPYADTQLLISLLGVLVFPQERAPDALGDLLQGYKALGDVLTIRFARPKDNALEIAGPHGELERIDPTNLKDLPRLLRNSIAHFNVRPIDKDGRFGGVRIWNVDDNQQITMVADIDFDALRPLATHILKSLANPAPDIRLCDPEDPLLKLEAHETPNEKQKKPPKISDAVWQPLLEANGGIYDAAKIHLDRLLAREVRSLRKSISNSAQS